MNNLQGSTVKAFLKEFFAPDLEANGLDPDSLDESLDLVQAGVIDSTGILEMTMAVEDEYGFELDLEGLPADQLVAIGPLGDYVAEQARLLLSR